MVDAASLLALYDERMRLPPGTPPTGTTYEHDGPLLRIVNDHLGRIRSPRDLGVTGPDLDRLIARQRDFFAARGQGVEWKVRGHDLPAELPDRLVAAGFVPQPSSTVLVGLAEQLAGDPVLPGGVVLRQVSEPADLHRIAAQQTEVWGFDCSWVAGELGSRVSAYPDQIVVLVAEAGGEIVCSAWTLFHPETGFAALLGGTTVAAWRGRGIYRAMITVRARDAAARGVGLLQVDASPASAPILLRSGFHAIGTATPYVWSAPV